jgi:NAD(P)-dependent dehydrogenase (short-subunit alcohol dehydrogenase family)
MLRESPETGLLEVPVFEINDQHILVTGGSSGFGRHFARFLASNGRQSYARGAPR